MKNHKIDQNNFHITLYVTLAFIVISLFIQPFGIIGFISGLLYAQTIEWFVHGWIQHHPFKIFRKYRMAHMKHHKNPSEPASVQPVQYFIIGSLPLILPFIYFDGFWLGYFIMYAIINIVHWDLHVDKRILPTFIWNTDYFKFIESHHKKHHDGHTDNHTTHSVTNPYMDYFFDKIQLTKFNNYIAKHLKI